MNNNVIKKIKLNDDFFTATKISQNSDDTYFLVKISQVLDIYDLIDSIDIICQNNRTFNQSFLDPNYTFTLDRKKYSKSKKNSNEISNYYERSFENKVNAFSEYSGSGNIFYKITKQNLYQTNDELYFVIPKEVTENIKNLSLGGIRILIKDAYDKIISDTGSVSVNFESVYENANTAESILLKSFIFDNIVNDIKIYFDNNVMIVELPKISESFIEEVSLCINYNGKDYKNFVRSKRSLRDVSNCRFDLFETVFNNETNASTCAANIYSDYISNKEVFDFKIFFGASLSDNSVLTKLIEKSISRKNNKISNLIKSIESFALNNELNKIEIETNAGFTENFRSIFLEIDSSFDESFIENIFIKELKVNGIKIQRTFFNQDLKNENLRLDRKRSLFRFLKANDQQNLNKTFLYIDATGIERIKSVSFLIECESTQTKNEANKRIYNFAFNISRYALSLDTTFNLDISNFLSVSKEKVNIQTGIKHTIDNNNLSYCEINTLDITDIYNFTDIANNFGYSINGDDNQENIIESFIKNCLVKIKTFCKIKNQKFVKETYAQLKNVGVIENRNFVFDLSFLKNSSTDHYFIFRLLNQDSKENLRFLLEEKINRKKSILQSVNTSQIEEKVEVFILPIPKLMHKYRNKGLDNNNNINNYFEDIYERNIANLEFHSYLLHNNIPFIYHNNIKKNYFSKTSNEKNVIKLLFDVFEKESSVERKIVKHKKVIQKNDFLSLVKGLNEINLQEKTSIDFYSKMQEYNIKEDMVFAQKSKTLLTDKVNNTIKSSNIDNLFIDIIGEQKTDAKNINSFTKLYIVHKDYIYLPVALYDFIDGESKEEIVQKNITVNVIPSFTSFSANAKEYVEVKDLIVDNNTVYPSNYYFSKIKKENIMFFTDSVLSSDCDIVLIKEKHYLKVNCTSTSSKKSFAKTNFFSLYQPLFSLVENLGLNILNDVEIKYNVSVKTSSGKLLSESYSLSLLENFKEKIYIINNIQEFGFQRR